MSISSIAGTEIASNLRSPVPPHPLRHELLRVAGLILLAVGIWCWLTGRVNHAAWQVPLEYGLRGVDGDAQFHLSAIKGVADHEYLLGFPKNIHHLGAPYYCSRSDFPEVEEWQYLLPGRLTRWIGLFAAANLSVLVAQVLACVCFYITARLLGCKWWWAFAGAIAFGFARYAFARSLHHITYTHYWDVPFCLLIAGWISRNEMGGLRERRYLFSLLASFVIGMQDPYYTNLFLQLVILGAFYQYFRQGWKPVFQAAGIVGASMAGFFLMTVDTLWYQFTHGRNPAAMVREYKWLELGALRLVDLLVPPQDHPLLGALGEAYYGPIKGAYDPRAIKMVAFPGEVPPSCYLGLFGIAALLWLAVIAVRRLAVQDWRKPPLEACQVLWILAYAAGGGLNCLAGTLGMTIFRSTNRYSIFILPIVLLFAVKGLSRMLIDRKRGVLLAAFCALLALWDQVPATPPEMQMAKVARVVDADREFTRKLEGRVPKGSMIFQFPIMDFPESPFPKVGSYDHFRPYLYSKDLRFSFGAVKGRPMLQWQGEIGRLPFPDAIHALETYGFAALYVNRNGFPDQGEGILKECRRLGYTDVLESRFGDLYCVFIHPNASPVLPAGKLD